MLKNGANKTLSRISKNLGDRQQLCGKPPIMFSLNRFNFKKIVLVLFLQRDFGHVKKNLNFLFLFFHDSPLV